MFKRFSYLVIIITLISPSALAEEPGGIISDFFTGKKEEEKKKPKLPPKPKKEEEEEVVILIEPKILFTEEELGNDTYGPVDEREESIIAVEYKAEEKLACHPTPSVRSIYRNTKPIQKSNNLVQRVGSPTRAVGHFTKITGLLTDENCLPIQGAVVEIWQADRLGNYEWSYETDSYFELPLEGRDKNFVFSGTAQTDNLGQYTLMTILPGSKSKSAPHINIIIKKEGYRTLRTRMYFAKHPRNEKDPVLVSISGEGHDALIAKGKKLVGQIDGRLYYFPVTMSGIGAYKRY